MNPAKIDVYCVAIVVISITFGACTDDVELPEEIHNIHNLTIYPKDADPISNITLIQEQIFGDTNEILIGNITDLAIDEKARVYVADDQRGKIHVFDSNDDYMKSIGEKGRGPEEFQDIAQITYFENHLYAYDYLQRNIHIYSLDSLKLNRVIPLSSEKWNRIANLKHSFPIAFYLKDKNTFLMEFAEIAPPGKTDGKTYNRLYIMNNKGVIVSDLIIKKKSPAYLISNSGNLLSPPFIRSSLMAISDRGNIYHAWSEDFLIKVYNEHGRYLRAFYYPYNKSKLIKKEVLELYDDQPLLYQAYSKIVFPSTWPALNTMVMDDKNRLWISTITDNEKEYSWWVLDKSGELLAKFDWPGNRMKRSIHSPPLGVIKNGYYYERQIDKKKGAQIIVKYRIRMD